MESSFTLFRVRGIRIGANWSWLFVFAFIIYTLTQEFSRTYPGLSRGDYIGMAVAAGVLFVVSLLLHELGHAFRALREGMEIEGITLWFFGGVARFKGMFPSAGAEFRIAIAGPVVSAVICAIFAAITMALNSADAPAQVVGVTNHIAFINGVLLAFNMVPALPLDGGRVFRAYLWYRQGSFTSATISAARTARIIAGVLIAFGVLTYVEGAGVSGLWLSFIGWFLLQAAQSEAAFARLRSNLRGLRVRDVMTPNPVVVRPELGIDDLIEEFAHTRGHSTFPVVDAAGRLSGLVSLRMAGLQPPGERSGKAVRDVMASADRVPVVGPDDEVLDVLARLQQPPGRAVVVDRDRVIGIVAGSDIARAVELEGLRGRPVREVAEPPPRRRTRATWIVPLVFLVGAGGFLFHPPFAVLAPGASFDVVGDVRVTEIRADRVDGKYLLTSVAVEQPNAFGFIASIARSREIVPIGAIVPRGTDPERFFREQQKMFEQSQLVAAGAAAKAAGMPVSLSGRGSRVTAVVPGAPAGRVLAKGDVIVAVDGRPVSLAEEVGAAIRSRPAGTLFTFTIERIDRRIEVKARSRTGLTQEGPAIGILTETRDLKVRLPFEVEFRRHDIGGTSAGLAYALAVYDLIKPGDLARGRSVAATGTIDVDGRVGPIGGVREKAAAARDAGAKLFLVPSEELSGAHDTGIETHGVSTLEEAIAVLSRSR